MTLRYFGNPAELPLDLRQKLIAKKAMGHDIKLKRRSHHKKLGKGPLPFHVKTSLRAMIEAEGDQRIMNCLSMPLNSRQPDVFPHQE